MACRELYRGWIVSVVVSLLCRETAWTQDITAKHPKVLSTAYEVHSLQATEAGRHDPVRIRGWVAYYDAYADPGQAFLFLHDDTGDVFVSLPKLPVLTVKQGTPVEVTGVADSGEFAPIVARGKAQVLAGPVRRLSGPRVELPMLLLGAYDARFATISGVVQAAFGSKRSMVLKLSTANGILRATTLREPGVDYGQLVDAQIEIRANIGPEFNHRRQVTGVHLFFASMEDVRIVKKPPPDSFARPPRPINDMVKASSGLGVLNSIRLQGQATLHWPGRLLCLQDATGGLCVESNQTDRVSPGEMVAVVGFPQVQDATAGLVEARFQRLGASQPLKAAKTTAADLLRGNHADDLVTLEAKLIGLSQDDPNIVLAGEVLTMEADGKVFSAVMPSGSLQAGKRAPERGSVLRLTGVALPELNRHRREIEERESGYDSFRLLLRTPEDVEVMQTPLWWNGPRVVYVLLSCALVGTLGCVWVIVLRRRVAQQTKVIRASEELFRHLAEHDGLTGLANRRLLHDRLEAAIGEAIAKGRKLAVLMMDLDKFKQVNDGFGHPAGDAMLRAAAERITQSVREGDTVARMGGDEFVVLLPVVSDAEEATAAAERIVTAIAKPLMVDGLCVPMSASVGVCIYPEGGSTPDSLLGNCDQALYRAKARGRNCWQTFAADHAGQTAQAVLC